MAGGLRGSLRLTEYLLILSVLFRVSSIGSVESDPPSVEWLMK